MIRPILLIFSFCLSLTSALAQEDCYLGLGGKNDSTIISVFQLNEFQIEQMKNWGAELNYRNGFLRDRANYLLKKHAQDSPEDLIEMSYEYQKLMDSMKSNMRMLDQRLLSLFNDNQYNLYVKLCHQVSRSPIFANRQVDEK
ncbi:hypothetical protein [Allomuricauda sp. d1]|uniref:hypothetical protein n=1 Tax=Allomuricauda sp. d1 TaxID=3136725 RepID=UPI0031D22062